MNDIPEAEWERLARAWARGYMAADPDADPIEVARINPYQPRQKKNL